MALFKPGTKQVFLFPHVITFLNKPKQPHNFATFQVPLRFTKFDIRDYLWHVYNVAVKGVRSQVRLSPIQSRPYGKQAYRPLSKKFMTVELIKPFVWPDPPENLEAWNKTLWDSRQEEWDLQSKEHMDQVRGAIQMRSEAKNTIDEKTPGPIRKKRGARRKPIDKAEVEWKTRLIPDERKKLAQMAAALRNGQNGWKQELELDPIWSRKSTVDYAPKPQRMAREALKEALRVQNEATDP